MSWWFVKTACAEIGLHMASKYGDQWHKFERLTPAKMYPGLA